MKRNFYLIIILFLLGRFGLEAQPIHDHYYNLQSLDTNNINIHLNNHGSLHSDYPWFSAQWSQISDSLCQGILYDQGFWVIGKINDYTHLALNQWSVYYSPGPIINGQAAMLVNPQDSLRYRIYKISRGDDNSNPDYAEWPEDFGAPVDDQGNPKFYGDQTLWTVYNGVDSSLTQRQWWNANRDTLPTMPVEVQQLAFSRSGNSPDSIDIFSNVSFFEWIIINKGDEIIDSAFIGFWTDIDFFGAVENFPGVDTVHQLGYCWYGSSSTSWCDGTPPAIGYALLYGPVVPQTGSNAIHKGRLLENFTNLPITSFHGIADDASLQPLLKPAHSLPEAWNIARGFDTEGNVIIDPTSGLETKFPFSGDPVTQSGWIFSGNPGGGAGFNIFSGPVTLAPNDTQWVMIALVPGLGEDRFESIEIMREKAALLRSLPYDSLAFGTTPYYGTDVDDENGNVLPVEYKLHQNYPNPFNPTTTIEYAIPAVGTRHTVSVQIEVFDVLGREVAVLVNEEKSPGIYEVVFDGSGLPSGVYFYTLQAGSYIATKKMLLIK